LHNTRLLVWVLILVGVLGGAVAAVLYLTQHELPPATERVVGAATRGNLPGELAEPAGVAVDPSGNSYAVDTGNQRIQRFDVEGRLIDGVGRSGRGSESVP